MTKIRLAGAVLLLVALLALGAAVPALAADSAPGPAPMVRVYQPQDGETPSENRIEPMVLWTVAGVLIGCLVGGTFYLLKRRVGGFPKNPTWVAPISIMESKTFPDEDYGDAPPAGAQHQAMHAHDL